MWLALFAFIVLVVGIIGSIASGGIFLIVLVPIGVIAAIAAAFSAWFGGNAARTRTRTERATSPVGPQQEEPPLPHSPPAGAAAPVTPEQQTEARLQQQ
jgi:hypothetical protein